MHYGIYPIGLSGVASIYEYILLVKQAGPGQRMSMLTRRSYNYLTI